MENTSKEPQQKKDKFVLNQSNTNSKTIIKVSSATANKIIKYGTHKLDLKFRFNETKKTLSEYKQMNLLNADNWKNVNWNDFSCEYSVLEFCEFLNISDGTYQRKEIKKAISDALKEEVLITKKNEETGEIYNDWYNWFVHARYIENPADKTGKEIKLRFNPGVICTALVNNGEYYSLIELLVIGKMKSLYSQRLYELIKSFYYMRGKYDNPPRIWKTDWYSVEYMKKFLQCEMFYVGRVDNFITKAIKNPVEEINQVCEELGINLHVEVELERGGKGGRLKALRFICTETLEIVKSAVIKDDNKNTEEGCQ